MLDHFDVGVLGARLQMSWDRWQSLLLLLLLWVTEFTVEDEIAWAVVLAIFLLAFMLVYFLFRRANNRTDLGNGNMIHLLMAQIAALDERIERLEAELVDVKRQRADLVRQAQGYTSLQRELEGSPVVMEAPTTPATIRVLLVAPKSNLPLATAEMQDVQRSGLMVTPVFSPVSQVILTREILAGNHDGLWLAGHMDDQGSFLLDNNELLSAPALASLVRGRFQWVYLNSCQSIFAAQSLQNETDADVICTVIDVPDIDAYRSGALFAHWLARLDDVRGAYEQSRPGGNRVYVYLSSGRSRIMAGRE